MVGRYLMRELRLGGADAIAIVRSPNKAPSLPDQGYACRVADLEDRASLEKAMQGLDAVMSNAALIAVGGQPASKVLRTNVDGTRNTFEAMASAGVKRAVLTSSAIVYRPRSRAEEDAVRLGSERAHRFNCYAISKAAAEEVARDVGRKNGIDLSIARPYQIYGAFDHKGFTAHLRRMMRPRGISVWMTHWYFASVYAGDLADAMCRMLENDDAVGETFNICGEPNRDSYWDHYEAWREAGGRVPWVVLPFPMPLRRSFSIDKAKRVLGWSPRPLRDGFTDLVRFERSAEWATR